MLTLASWLRANPRTSIAFLTAAAGLVAHEFVDVGWLQHACAIVGGLGLIVGGLLAKDAPSAEPSK